MMNEAEIDAYFAASAGILVTTGAACKADILRIAGLLVDAIQSRNKIMLCGNGGSAADAQHFAAELVGRFDRSVERLALPAIALTTDTSFLTAYANDYEFSGVFARQVEGIGQPGDVLVLISTSGNSPNLCVAAEAAQAKSIRTVAFLGAGGGRLGAMVEDSIIVPAESPQHVQECHAVVVHSVCFAIERTLFGNASKARKQRSDYDAR